MATYLRDAKHPVLKAIPYPPKLRVDADSDFRTGAGTEGHRYFGGILLNGWWPPNLLSNPHSESRTANYT